MMRRHYQVATAVLLATSGIVLLMLVACSSNSADDAPPLTAQPSDSDASNADATATSAIDSGVHDAADADTGLSHCPTLTNDTPSGLECTGLYSNIDTKQIADGVREFTPAIALWSDGADKTRWIYLPPGTTIDSTNSSEWKFPVGTKLWKEFRVNGHRIETRLFQKLADDFWVHASYQWSTDEASATRADGADLALNDGSAYHIPTPSECDKCHNGRRDRVLGFEAISLGLSNAAGLTLARLVKEGRLSPTPAVTSYTIGDSTGKAAKALGWLNINCGVTCHNENTTAAAYPTGLRLRLDPSKLDGGAIDDSWTAIQTSVNIGAITPRWSGSVRISPGQPNKSLLLQLISERGTEQMPPIDSVVVDEEGVKLVRDWIASMPKNDAGTDAGSTTDSGIFDAGDGGD